MPGWRRLLSVAAVGLALLPATAAAQSAGDNQYEDPFGDQQGQAKPSATPAPATPAPATPAPAPATQAQATATVAPAAPSQPAPATAAAAVPAQAQLPRTGDDAWLPGLLGCVLLSAGVALRARARRAP